MPPAVRVAPSGSPANVPRTGSAPSLSLTRNAVPTGALALTAGVSVPPGVTAPLTDSVRPNPHRERAAVGEVADRQRLVDDERALVVHGPRDGAGPTGTGRRH